MMFLAGSLGLSLAHAISQFSADQPHYAELVFAIDNSGSSLYAQETFRGMALEMTSATVKKYGKGRVRVAVIGYLTSAETAQVRPFTKDLGEMVRNCVNPFNFEKSSAKGEAATDVTLAALRQLDWSEGKDVKRTLVLMGNEPPEQGRASTAEVIKQATSDKITVNAIFAPDHKLAGSPAGWQAMAKETKGNFHIVTRDDIKTFTPVFRAFSAEVQAEAEQMAREKAISDLLKEKQAMRGRGG